jgi:lipopolysaccharide transport system permease protein
MTPASVAAARAQLLTRGHLRLAPLGGLLWTLVRTDFKTRYHGSVQGFVWALLKPLAMFVILFAVFSLVFGNDRGYSLNLMIGLFLWDFFADGTKTAMVSLHTKGFLITKARLPSWIFVVASISNAMITLLVFTTILLAYLALTTGLPPLGHLLWLAYYFAAFTAIVIGTGLGTSVLFLKYRDLNQIWDVIIQAGFFVAPIIVPLRVLPERVHAYLYLWPPTPIIQFSRAVLVDGTVPTPRAHLFLAAGTATIVAAGSLIFALRARRIAEDL